MMIAVDFQWLDARKPSLRRGRPASSRTQLPEK
jgi:hypothetical protein